MTKHKIGFGFCSHVDETGKLSTHEPLYKNGEIVGKLALFPEWRIRGFATAIKMGEIDELVLMGPISEIEAYRHHLEESGTPASKISCIVTGNSTRDAALTLKPYLKMKGIKAGAWEVISSNYHIRRVQLTAKILHSFNIYEIHAAEHYLFRQAFLEGGEAAQLRLIEEIAYSRDPVEEQLRRLYEEKGCAQLEAGPKSYKPKKK